MRQEILNEIKVVVDTLAEFTAKADDHVDSINKIVDSLSAEQEKLQETEGSSTELADFINELDYANEKIAYAVTEINTRLDKIRNLK